MQVGDYVRTKDGYIRKVIQVNQKGTYEALCYGAYSVDKTYKNSVGISAKKVKKYSKDIIDLIEVGDYVNGYKVYEENGYLWVKRISEDEYKVPHYTRIDFDGFKIKSIVTKEQFEEIEYKIC